MLQSMSLLFFLLILMFDLLGVLGSDHPFQARNAYAELSDELI